MQQFRNTSTKLRCDNPNIQCGWELNNINFEKVKDWVNKPCPNCGEIVVTEQEYKSIVDLRDGINQLNELSSGESNMIMEIFKLHVKTNKKYLKTSPAFAQTKGLDDITGDGDLEFIYSARNGKVIVEKVIEHRNDESNLSQ